MSYIADIFAFQDWIEYESSITPNEIALWYALVRIFNKLGNPEELEIPIATLIPKCKLSRGQIYTSRNKLKQLGVIDFKERKGNQCTVYTSTKFTKPSIDKNEFAVQFQNTNQTKTQTQVKHKAEHKSDTKPNTASSESRMDIEVEAPLKTKIKTKIKENIPKDIQKKKSFGIHSNVLLTEKQYENLHKKFGDDLLEMINILSEYIARKGGKSEREDHNLVLQGWVKNAIKEQKLKNQEFELRERELEARKKRLETGYLYPKSEVNRDRKPSYDIEEHKKYCRELLFNEKLV